MASRELPIQNVFGLSRKRIQQSSQHYRFPPRRTARLTERIACDEEVVQQVDSKGPAQRAGLQVGMKIEDLRVVPGDVETKVRLRQDGRELSFRPVAGKLKAWTWRATEQCN